MPSAWIKYYLRPRGRPRHRSHGEEVPSAWIKYYLREDGPMPYLFPVADKCVIPISRGGWDPDRGGNEFWARALARYGDAAGATLLRRRRSRDPLPALEEHLDASGSLIGQLAECRGEHVVYNASGNALYAARISGSDGDGGAGGGGCSPHNWKRAVPRAMRDKERGAILRGDNECKGHASRIQKGKAGRPVVRPPHMEEDSDSQIRCRQPAAQEPCRLGQGGREEGPRRVRPGALPPEDERQDS